MARSIFRIFGEAYEPGNMEISDGGLTSGNGKKAVFTDFASGDKIVIEGKGLTFNDGLFQDGVVTKLSVIDANGDRYQVMDGFKVAVALLSGDNLINQLNDLSNSVLSGNVKVVGNSAAEGLISREGNDIIFGRGGNDTLGSEGGRDVLIGGAGSDVFVFAENYGKDTIRDFDADGSDGSQDHIDADFDAIAAISRSGKNTVIDFGDGDVLTLLGVLPAAIGTADFYNGDM